jgi:hypothetical protein
MLVRAVDIDLAAYPILTWRWFIELPIRSPLDESTREGDDHPAPLFPRFLTDGGEKRTMEYEESRARYARPRLATTMSGLIGISGFEEREFEGDRSTKEVAAHIPVGRADTVQLRA